MEYVIKVIDICRRPLCSANRSVVSLVMFEESHFSAIFLHQCVDFLVKRYSNSVSGDYVKRFLGSILTSTSFSFHGSI